MPHGLVFNPQSSKKPVFKQQSVKSPVFTNNSMIYYRKGSLASGGVGTVRNSHHKSKYT